MFQTIKAAMLEKNKAKVVLDLLRSHGATASAIDSAEWTWLNKIDIVNSHVHRWSRR